MTVNYKQIYMIDKKNKERWLKLEPTLNNMPGIYILTREENGFKYAYIGQAKKILSRLADHLRGFQHIDLSLKNHGLYDSEKNPTGWWVSYLNYEENQLDEMEQYWIKRYANAGYQLRNKTAGGQSEGKVAINEYRPVKGFRDGIAKGKKDSQKEIAHLFDKYLDFSIKGKPNKIKQRAFDKFTQYLEVSNGDD